jgi:hypothetical protein
VDSATVEADAHLEAPAETLLVEPAAEATRTRPQALEDYQAAKRAHKADWAKSRAS